MPEFEALPLRSCAEPARLWRPSVAGMERFEMSSSVELYPTDSFGRDYLAEFNRVLDRFLRAAPGNILEWGAGYTTLELLRRLDANGCRLFVTIDDNEEYLREVLKHSEPRPWFRPITEGLIGPRKNQSDPELAYSTSPLLLGEVFDFIYIDGRRRMECALTSALLAHEETIIVLHDYRRGRYQPVRALFDIVEDGVAFRVMKPRRELLPLIRERALGIVTDVGLLQARLAVP
jgi:hypothetical protein